MRDEIENDIDIDPKERTMYVSFLYNVENGSACQDYQDSRSQEQKLEVLADWSDEEHSLRDFYDLV